MQKMASIVFFLISILWSNQLISQSFEKLADDLQRAEKDTTHTKGLKIIYKMLELDPNNERIHNYLIYLHFRSMDHPSVCADIQRTKNLGGKIERQIQRYSDLFCSGSEMKSPYKRKLFKQKFHDKLYYAPTKIDSLRGTLNGFRSCYDVNYYKLDIELNPKTKTIQGSVILKYTIIGPSNQLQIDAHKDLVIDSIRFLGAKKAFTRFENFIFIDNPLQIGDTSSIEVFYHGKPKIAVDPPWEGGFVWKKNKSSKVWAGVACEHLGASFWWPCKDHPTEEPDSMDVIITTLNPYKAISNGNLVSETPMGNNKTKYHWHIAYPINNYNVTFYLGQFVSYQEKYRYDTAGKRLEFYVMPHNLTKAKQHFSQTHEIIRFYEKAFGPYAFWKDGFALVESPYAGMEHQSAIAIGGDYGSLPEYKYISAKEDQLIVHEAAHEWWGNSVTAADMADAWIQEGFATYAELMFIEDKYGHDAYLEEISGKFDEVLNYWPIIGAAGINDNSFVGGDIYTKGALFLHNLRSTINNDSLFFGILKDFYQMNTLKTVQTSDFLSLVNQRTQSDFTTLFNVYLGTTKIPILEYSFIPNKNGIRFSFRWKNVPENFQMPFGIKLSNKEYLRILATTTKETILLDGVTHFDFLNRYINIKNCPKNTMTYFYTEYKHTSP